jgi:tRNA A37 methylthiotransferase MiaB
MATFGVRFLGCKVSQTDAQAVRDRLLADGHEERDGPADVAVVNTCCVTHEAVRKSRHAAARAARTHRRVYVTGCGANLAGEAFGDLGRKSESSRARARRPRPQSRAMSARSPASRRSRGSTASERS